MELPRELTQMDASQLRDLTAALFAQLADRDAQISQQHALIASRDQELKHKQLKIDQLTHEMATLNRYRFGRHSEQLDGMQRSLLDESIDADIEAIALEIEALKLPSVPRLKDKPRRVAGLFPTPRSLARARGDALQLRLQLGAHGRGCERETRLYAGRVHG